MDEEFPCSSSFFANRQIEGIVQLLIQLLIKSICFMSVNQKMTVLLGKQNNAYVR
jgi:hypothetical protein